MNGRSIWNIIILAWVLIAGIVLHECLHGAAALAADVIEGDSFDVDEIRVGIGPWNGNKYVWSGTFMLAQSGEEPGWLLHEHAWIYPVQWVFDALAAYGLWQQNKCSVTGGLRDRLVIVRMAAGATSGEPKGSDT